MNEEEIKLYPIAAMTVGPVPRLGIVVMRPDFLVTEMETTEQAHHGRTYALTPVQAKSLVQQIQKALAMLESAPPPDGGGQKH